MIAYKDKMDFQEQIKQRRLHQLKQMDKQRNLRIQRQRVLKDNPKATTKKRYPPGEEMKLERTKAYRLTQPVPKRDVNRPQRMKVYSCSFLIPTSSGVEVRREIVPVIATCPEHALDLCWTHHANYLTECFKGPLDEKKSSLSVGLHEYLSENIEIKELTEVYTGTGYATEEIRSLVG